MSAKIYFRTGPTQRLQRALIALGSFLHGRIAPQHALATAERILLTPTRLPAKNSEPAAIKKQFVDGPEGKIATYCLGSGPVWLLTHGWSGASHQFFPLMEHIASRGYTALAFDHLGHGASAGKYAHLPAFMQAIETVAKGHNIAGYIAHSMGGAALLQSGIADADDKPVLLIAPVLNYVENMYQTIERSGYSLRLFEQVTAKISQQYQFELASIDPIAKLQARQGSTIIVHDPGDRLARFEVSEAASRNASHVTLIKADKQGHGRVMKCRASKQAFDQLVDYAPAQQGVV
ncbi:alpha/beta hydrolase [Salinibius halmophilus]|uniref:alpha/beta hydrolase n=1 Tax=Salinibius halmophilus TaxID=1853216 RepID=UPI000E66C0A2|nr:alpha/beta fold hydrolase [Salinibius halmophilus]